MLYSKLTDLGINYENTVDCQEKIVEKTGFKQISDGWNDNRKLLRIKIYKLFSIDSLSFRNQNGKTAYIKVNIPFPCL